MTTEQIVRSWKDEEYLLALSDDEQAQLPENPAGWVELSDDDLLGVAGGTDTLAICSFLLSIGSLAASLASYLHCSVDICGSIAPPRR